MKCFLRTRSTETHHLEYWRHPGQTTPAPTPGLSRVYEHQPHRFDGRSPPHFSHGVSTPGHRRPGSLQPTKLQCGWVRDRAGAIPRLQQGSTCRSSPPSSALQKPGVHAPGARAAPAPASGQTDPSLDGRRPETEQHLPDTQGLRINVPSRQISDDFSISMLGDPDLTPGECPLPTWTAGDLQTPQTPTW